MDDGIAVLKELGISYAYDHFAEGEGPDPPFVVYRFPASDNFDADGEVYYAVNEVNIELYTDTKNPGLEQKLERILKAHGIVWDKDETWIPEERLYEVIYDFEVPMASEEVSDNEVSKTQEE